MKKNEIKRKEHNENTRSDLRGGTIALRSSLWRRHPARRPRPDGTRGPGSFALVLAFQWHRHSCLP